MKRLKFFISKYFSGVGPAVDQTNRHVVDLFGYYHYYQLPFYSVSINLDMYDFGNKSFWLNLLLSVFFNFRVKVYKIKQALLKFALHYESKYLNVIHYL
jgi:hypothetical protein